MKSEIKITGLLTLLISFVIWSLYTNGPQSTISYYGHLAFAALIFGLCSLVYWEHRNPRLRVIKLTILIVSLISIIIGLLGFKFHVPYKQLYIVLGVFSYSFFYSPLVLKSKFNKWSYYTSNRLELIGLSSLDFLGINLLLIGGLNKILRWPGQETLLYSGASLLGIGMIFWNRKFKAEIIRRKESHDKIQEQYEELTKEKHKVDSLLLNILPAEVASELKEKGESEARDFDDVTVLFTDFEEFTQTAEKLTAKELVNEINTCFKAFDEIIERYRIEKIKTIGDAYMAAGGLHIPRTSEPHDVVKAALEMQGFMLNRKAEHLALGLPFFDMRVGIHTGPVVAGIVGVKKFQYDIWGDTVNTASRMESHGTIGSVNISNETYELIKNDPTFSFESRGKIEVKGKGEMEMWFVNHTKLNLL